MLQNSEFRLRRMQKTADLRAVKADKEAPVSAASAAAHVREARSRQSCAWMTARESGPRGPGAGERGGGAPGRARRRAVFACSTLRFEDPSLGGEAEARLGAPAPAPAAALC